MLSIQSIPEARYPINPSMGKSFKEQYPNAQLLDFFVTEDEKTVNFYLIDNVMLGTIDDIVVYSLNLKPFLYEKDIVNELKKEIVQVARTYTALNYRSLGICNAAYYALVKSGYCLVCHDIQTIATAAVWRNIAKDSVSSRFKVYVYSNGSLLKDSEGNYIEYIDTNTIPDKDLWSVLPDRSKEKVFFVLAKV